MATHSSILAWRIPWTEEPGWPQSIGVAKSRTRLSTTQLSLWGHRAFHKPEMDAFYLPGRPQLDQRHVGRERRVLELGTFVPTSRQEVMGLEIPSLLSSHSRVNP